MKNFSKSNLIPFLPFVAAFLFVFCSNYCNAAFQGLNAGTSMRRVATGPKTLFTVGGSGGINPLGVSTKQNMVRFASGARNFGPFSGRHHSAIQPVLAVQNLSEWKGTNNNYEDKESIEVQERKEQLYEKLYGEDGGAQAEWDAVKTVFQLMPTDAQKQSVKLALPAGVAIQALDALSALKNDFLVHKRKVKNDNKSRGPQFQKDPDRVGYTAQMFAIIDAAIKKVYPHYEGEKDDLRWKLTTFAQIFTDAAEFCHQFTLVQPNIINQGFYDEAFMELLEARGIQLNEIHFWLISRVKKYLADFKNQNESPEKQEEIIFLMFADPDHSPMKKVRSMTN